MLSPLVSLLCLLSLTSLATSYTPSLPTPASTTRRAVFRAPFMAAAPLLLLLPNGATAAPDDDRVFQGMYADPTVPCVFRAIEYAPGGTGIVSVSGGNGKVKQGKEEEENGDVRQEREGARRAEE